MNDHDFPHPANVHLFPPCPVRYSSWLDTGVEDEEEVKFAMKKKIKKSKKKKISSFVCEFCGECYKCCTQKPCKGRIEYEKVEDEEEFF